MAAGQTQWEQTLKALEAAAPAIKGAIDRKQLKLDFPKPEFDEGWWGTLEEFLWKLSVDFTKSLHATTKPWSHDMITWLKLPPSLSKTLKDSIPNIPLVDLGYTFLLVSAAFSGYIASIGGIVNREYSYDLNKEMHNLLATPGELVPLLWRKKPGGGLWRDFWEDIALKHGYDDKAQEALVEAARPHLPANVWLWAMVRKIMPMEKAMDMASQWGYDPTEIATMLAREYAYPDMPTIVQAVNRQIITPQAAAEWWQYLGFRPEMSDKLKELRWEPFAIQEVGELYRRGLLTDARLDDALLAQGIKPERQPAYREMFHSLMPLDFLQTLYWRKALTAEQLTDRLQQLGFKQEDMKLFSTLWNPKDPYSGNVPPFPDIIRMAVRDAFDETAARKYGLDVNYPAKVGEFADMTGFGEYWARMYWRAHWQLPGFQTARRMMFMSDRFSTADLQKMLIYADFPPYLVPAMMDSAYNPLSRVDVRRMHRVGVVSNQGLFRAYKRIGYTDDDAKSMAEFTIEYNREETRSSSKTRVINALKEYLLTEAEARDFLKKLGFDHDEIDAWITGALVDRALEREQDMVDTIGKRFKTRLLTRNEARDALGHLGYDAGRIGMIFAMWDNAILRAIRRPSKTDFDKFLKKNLVTEVEYIEELEGLGYATKHAHYYLALVRG